MVPAIFPQCIYKKKAPISWGPLISSANCISLKLILKTIFKLGLNTQSQ